MGSVRHLLPGEKMVSAIQILTAIATVVVNGQPAGDKPLEECCDMKTVGGVTYTLSGQMNTKMYNCLNDCVYQMEGRPEAKFCFAIGDQEVECNDNEVVGSKRPPMEGSERPPMEGSERPPMEGSERPPVGEGSSPAPGSSGYTQAWLRGDGPYGHVHEGVRLEAGDGWVGVGDAVEEENTVDKTQVMVRRVDNEG